MALTSTDFNISFDLSSSPQPTFVLTDITDYTESGVTGAIKITAPSGETYTGSVDVDVSRINNTILVPTLSTGTPEVGLYTFKYTATAGSSSVSKVKTFQYSYVKPTATNQATSDCLSPELKGSDTTNYLVNGITPSDRFGVSAVSTSSNTFSLAGEKSAFVSVGDTFSVINSTGNNGDYTVTGVSYTKSSDTTVITVASVTDATVDGTLVTRKTTLFYPSVLQLSPLVGYEKIISTNSFYSQTHEFLFTTKGYWDYGNGIKIVDSFSSTKEIDVDCDVRLCDIFCCVNATFKEYLKYKCVNKTLADIALERYTIATSHLAALRTAFECGDSAAVDSLTTQIKEVAQCNDDCSCSDGDPTPITGLGGSGNVVVNAANSNIEVASNVVGNTTTYTVKLAQSVLNDIASSGSITTIDSSDSSITVLETPTGSNYAYDIKLASSIISPKEFMAFNVSVTDINSTPVFSVSDVVIQNASNFQTPTVSVKNTTPTTNTQGFKVFNFQSTSNSTYKAFVDVTYVESQPSESYGTLSSSSYDVFFSNFLTSVISKKDSGSFEFVLLKEGIPLTIADFKSSSSSKLNLNIKIVE